MKIRIQDKNLMIQLAKETIKTPAQLIAFGSRVNGEAHDGSDIDLVIKADSQKEISIKMFQDFQNRLRESNLPIVVDVMDWYRIPESFHENIINNCELLVKL